MNIFDSSITALTIWDYQLSWLELIGTLLNISTVYLITKRKIINWPIGIIASALFAILFFQFRLYSDFIENIYYIVTGFWGWWLWTRKYSKDKPDNVLVKKATARQIITSASTVAIGTLIMGYIVSNLHIWLPGYFSEEASLPYLDTLTTMMSFVAQILIAKRIMQNWYLWITVDLIGIWLYWYKGLKLVSLLYFAFLVLATKGLVDWRRQYRMQISESGVNQDEKV